MEDSTMMKIIVCVKQVPDTTEIKIDPVKGTLIRDGVPSIMNPDDKGGLELALRLKDQHGAHITVISMGPPQADVILREAFAMGADRAILLSDRKFAGADTLATSYALSGLCRTLDYDLIIAGRQAIDGDTAQVGPELAEHLDLPQITYVADAKRLDNGNLLVHKENEDSVQVLEVEGKCLLTVLASAFEPRYMSVNGIMKAYEREVEVWGADKIDVDESKLGLAGSPTKVFKSFPKALKAPGEVHEVSEEEAVELIINKLKEKHII
jgi:electron transfer flavoprotein beta subunit